MSHNSNPGGADESTLGRPLLTPIKRRSFFMYAGATAGATALLLSGCDDDSSSSDNGNGLVSVGTGDVGVLNYAYALEQLEAAFYTAVRTGAYYAGLGANSAEKQILDDLYYHEIIHRDFFRTAILDGGGTPIKGLTPDFSRIDFNAQASVLSSAMAFEDLGVAAYNGAGKYLALPRYILLAGKVVSVEARHAALIRDLISEATFVGDDIVNLSGNTSPERSKEPVAVVATANMFLAEGSKLDVSEIR